MAYEDSVYIIKHKIGISDETEVLNYIKVSVSYTKTTSAINSRKALDNLFYIPLPQTNACLLVYMYVLIWVHIRGSNIT